MPGSPRIVLVASGSSPDRALALAGLLASEAAATGWSDRLDLRVGGIDAGAGHASDAGRDAMREMGIDVADVHCPDLERRGELLEGAAVVVCDRGDVADVLVDWDEAGEATFVCVDEILGVADDDESREDVAIAEEVRAYQGVIDEVLRRVVADAASA